MDELDRFRVADGVYSPVAPVDRDEDDGVVHDVTAMYFAAALADSSRRGSEVISVEKVRRYAATRPGCDGELFSAAILRIADERDKALEKKSASCTLKRLAAEGVTQMNAEGAALALQMLERLGYADEIPPLKADLFEVENRTDRYHAWQTLALAPYLANKDEVLKHFEKQVSESGKFLKSPDSGTQFGEVVAASQVPGNGIGANEVPEKLRSWLDDSRGCDGIKEFYRPFPSADVCALKETWAGFSSGLVSP
ncbi:hypothetical protein QNO07_21665 [Streptomyces sp. 549]|uniref:hypothetical protein n=1 Tax=Streptomyces sp. 549 TaxID=3049076 RepID=UPI0024C28C56|nr:hypothetical protein [Streptomyces sp. 549]MDK1475993.1 hypothetical protein [Streptomyces sp. 549]